MENLVGSLILFITGSIFHRFDSAVCWENTLEALELERGTGGPNMVKEMDPDARCRTGKKLHDIDLEDKQRLLKALFMCVRC